MKQYRIFAGLSGGFGGAREVDILEFPDTGSAEDYAYEEACAIYESYEGLHGLRSVADIISEEGFSEEEAEDAYNEEREGWISYYVEEV
jgi:hypothetical protein